MGSMTWRSVERWRRSIAWCVGALTAVAASAAAQAQTADLTITKSGPGNALTGAAISYTLVIGNNGPDAANGATFTDTLPPGLTGVTASCSATGGATCPTMTVSNAQVSGAIPQLPADGGVTVIINGTLPTAPGSSSITNTATVSTPVGVTDPNPDTNTTTVNTVISAPADLVVTKTQVGPSGSSFFGSPVRYTVTFTNLSDLKVADVYVVDTLSATNAFAQGRPTGTFTRVSCTQGPNTNACLDSVFPASGSFDYISSWDHKLFEALVPTLGARESVTVVYDVVWQAGTGCTTYTDPETIANRAMIMHSSQSYVDPDMSSNIAMADLVPPVPPLCRYAVTTAKKTGSPAPGGFTSGTPYTFTVTYTNESDSEDISGTRITDDAGLSGFLAQNGGSYTIDSLTCSVNDATLVQCPTLPPSGSGTWAPASNSSLPLWTSSVVYSETVPLWKPGGVINVTYRLTPTVIAPTCALESGGDFVNMAEFAGYPDPITGYPQTQQVRYPAPSIAACPSFDMQVTQTVSSDRLRPNQPLEFTTTYTNVGPGNAPGVLLNESAALLGVLGTVGYEATFLTCTATSGSSCPPASAFTSPAGSGTSAELGFYKDAPATVAANGSITVRYRLSLKDVRPEYCGTTSGLLGQSSVWRSTTAQPPLIEDNPYDNGASVELMYDCADVSVIKSVVPPVANPGDPVTYTIEVTNAGGSPATAPVISDALPSGFVFDASPASMSCTGAACATPKWDAATRTVSLVPPVLEPGESVTLTLRGQAGPVGSYDNTAVVTATEYFDNVPASDRSIVNLRVGGPAPQEPVNTVTPVPTLGEWAMLALGAVVLLAGGAGVRRRGL